jgi:hypothetical protein
VAEPEQLPWRHLPDFLSPPLHRLIRIPTEVDSQKTAASSSVTVRGVAYCLELQSYTRFRNTTEIEVRNFVTDSPMPDGNWRREAGEISLKFEFGYPVSGFIAQSALI